MSRACGLSQRRWQETFDEIKRRAPRHFARVSEQGRGLKMIFGATLYNEEQVRELEAFARDRGRMFPPPRALDIPIIGAGAS